MKPRKAYRRFPASASYATRGGKPASWSGFIAATSLREATDRLTERLTRRGATKIDTRVTDPGETA